MRLSQLFTKTRKDAPTDETSKNAKLLIRAGYINKEMAGVYAYLPLGLKVVENIKDIVREEMNKIGGQELIMTSLQPKELWEKTDRWDDEKVDIWFKSKLKNGSEIGLAWSHEEPLVQMMNEHISSYNDMPVYTYQFQTKLRNETRAKSGIMRCREFVMKDLYSFSESEEQHKKFYDEITKAYLKIYERVGLGDDTFFTVASGGAFTEFSHEFQTVTENGEDIIYLNRDKEIAVNKEVYTDKVLKELNLNKAELEEVKASEVGNIFSFGGSKSEQLNLFFTDKNGQSMPVILGSYGVGITRLMGVIAEHFADDKGLVWPDNIAPARVYLVRIGEDEATVKAADELYNELSDNGVDVLYDDRDVRPGEKFADADLIGIPHRVVVSSKTVEAGKFEYKARSSESSDMLDKSRLFETLDVV